MINKEQFKEKDIIKWQKYWNKRKNNTWFESNYDDWFSVFKQAEFLHNLEIPYQLVFHLIEKKRPEYIKYFNGVKFIFDYLKETDYYWTRETNYLGWTTGKEITIKLKNNNEHSILSLAWIMLHEFRHVIQNQNSNIETNVNNQNVGKWLENYNKDINLLNHVFHEILPFEIDANTFACEMLEIDYPGSKFAITETTLAMLNPPEEKQKECQCFWHKNTNIGKMEKKNGHSIEHWKDNDKNNSEEHKNLLNDKEKTVKLK